MTQQGKRQARFRQWSGKSNTYNGDVIAAGMSASGLDGLTVNEADWWIQGAVSGTTATTLSGRQAATAERLNVPSGWDAVGDELPIAGWDFTSGGLFPDLTYGNPVAGAVSIDSLIYRSSGEARTSDLGLLSEVQTVNKCTNTNMKMTDTSGTTPDAAWTLHKNEPLDTLPDEVFDALPPFTTGKLTAVYHSVSNAAGVIVIDGVTGNTNPHYAGGWVYVVSGDFGFTIGGSPDVTTVTGEWIRIGSNSLTPLATDQMAAGSTQASEAYWFGNQLEENPDRTSLIEVQGSAVTRLGDYVYTSDVAITDYTAFVVVLEYELSVLNSQANPFRMLAYSGATLLENTVLNGTNIQRVTDGVLTAVDGPAATAGTSIRHAYGIDGSDLGLAIDGTFQGTSAIPAAGPYTQLTFGALVPGIRQSNGYIKRVAIYDTPATEATLVRLSA